MALHSRSPPMLVLFAGLSSKQTPHGLWAASISLVDRWSYHSRKRLLHSTRSKDIAIPVTTPYPTSSSTSVSPTTSILSTLKEPTTTTKTTQSSPLSTLTLSQILRTYLITSISSSPPLLNLSTALLRAMLSSRNPLFRIESNPLLRLLLKETFYKQFCAGATSPEIASSCASLHKQGYSGVILEYAAEILEQNPSASSCAASSPAEQAQREAADIAAWRAGMLSSVAMAAPGDFVGLKWSGMGSAAMRRMQEERPPTAAMEEAMHAVCRAAREKSIALLPAAEENWNLKGYHSWTLGLQRVFNADRTARCVVFNTYQAYLRSARTTLAEHMALASRENFTLGVKLVRGAYLGSEQERGVIWPSIEATHHSYDQILTALVERKFNEFLQPVEGNGNETSSSSLPAINVVLATHNAASVALAQRLRKAQREKGEELTTLAFAQLQGMADEVSCGLLAAGRTSEVATSKTGSAGGVNERVLKLTVWGTMTECLNYLLRRAAENKDAASRTSDTRKAMGREIRRRVRGVFSFA